MVMRFLRIAALGTAAFVATACATSFPNDYGLDANNALIVRQACSDIMGLRAGAEFEACAGSLASTVLSMQQADLLTRADQFCKDQGMVRGTPELTKCAVMFKWQAKQGGAPSLEAASANLAASSDAGASAPVPVIEALSKKYYHQMSHSEQDQRAELSCAQLGLHPAWGSFRQCVSNLQFSIVDVRFATPH